MLWSCSASKCSYPCSWPAASKSSCCSPAICTVNLYPLYFTAACVAFVSPWAAFHFSELAAHTSLLLRPSGFGNENIQEGSADSSLSLYPGASWQASLFSVCQFLYVPPSASTNFLCHRVKYFTKIHVVWSYSFFLSGKLFNKEVHLFDPEWFIYFSFYPVFHLPLLMYAWCIVIFRFWSFTDYCMVTGIIAWVLVQNTEIQGFLAWAGGVSSVY